MALPLRGQWDVTEVAKKYPWLRADQKAIEEFRSPFHWVDDSPRSPTQPNEQASDTHTLHHKKRARVQAKTQGELRAKHVKARRKQAKTSIRNHEELILQALNSSASDVQGVDNPPSDEEVEEPLLHLPSKEEDAPMLLSTPTVMVLPTPQDLDRIETPMLEFCRHDHEELVRLRNQKKKKKKAKKRKGPPSVLSLRFPALTSKPSPSLHNAHWMKQPKDFTPRTLLDKYSQELAHLAEEEHRIEQGVIARITEEKARLPLTFLFERNLINRSEAQQDGLRIVTGIFAKLQHRLLYAGFAHWREFLEAARHEERQREGLHIAKMRAVALLERVSSDAVPSMALEDTP
ncbi:hypothetical protein PHYBOEH_003631 [Phytophthora boehmeriae]|uniref:Uncharacterized protein n=1 Tax=Phytophthora boehmeriae TaxID=109152 RepID=A0A8T1WNE3_9STRA|nr:hypothetical protein PHYBOEH_003631 [Phytophthora boehmeriae]